MRASSCWLSTLVLVASGCVVRFDDQDLHWRYDVANDRMDLLVVYHGVWWDPSAGFEPESNEATARVFLDQVARGARLLGLFGILWSLTADPADPASALVDAHTFARPARFFMDGSSRLSVWQCMRIERFGLFLEKVNQLLRQELAKPAKMAKFRRDYQLTDERSGELLEQGLKQGWEFVRHQGSALVLRIPASADGHLALVRSQLQDLGRRRNRRERAQQIELLSSLEMSIVRNGEETALVLGNPGSLEQAVHLVGDGQDQDNLAPLVLEKGIEIRTDVTDAWLQQRFEEFVQSAR